MYYEKKLEDVPVVYLDPYHKYWLVYKQERNPKFDNVSSDLLKLKDLDVPTIEKFYDRLNSIVENIDMAICYVPSCEAGKNDTAVRRLAKKLVTSHRMDATSCIVRHTSIPKLARGGNRSIQGHLNSLQIVDADLIAGKKVLLLDDITTTGNSLNACTQLLKEAGAAEVHCLALGHTVLE